MVNQEEFNKLTNKFDILEKRGSFYPMFLNMIKEGFKVEAFLFILATWNFASFRYAMKDFDILNFSNKVGLLEPFFNKFKEEKFLTINFNNYKNDIFKIYNIFYDIKGIKSTGASKLMHLATPSIFVMWDGYIRKYYGYKKGDASDYFDFLEKMRGEFKNIKFDEKNKTFTKAIDEFNYTKITLPALNKK